MDRRVKTTSFSHNDSLDTMIKEISVNTGLSKTELITYLIQSYYDQVCKRQTSFYDTDVSYTQVMSEKMRDNFRQSYSGQR